MAIEVLSDLDFESTGKCQFLGVIAPATDTYVFLDDVTNSRLNTPTGVLRVLTFKAKLFNDSTNGLLVDNYSSPQIEKIFRNGSVIKSTLDGNALNVGNMFWDNNLTAFVPSFNFNTTTGDLDLFIDYTGGGNDYAFDVRLVVDVEYTDYPI